MLKSEVSERVRHLPFKLNVRLRFVGVTGESAAYLAHFYDQTYGFDGM